MAQAPRVNSSIQVQCPHAGGRSTFILHLEQGKRYRASRPLAVEGLDVFPVFIVDLASSQCSRVTLPPSYEEAGAIVAQLNKAIKEAGYG